ncbi:MAG: Histidine kinase [Pedosphaera sp.]|nr:Histidine kinase [Pedosphaera sp.]
MAASSAPKIPASAFAQHMECHREIAASVKMRFQKWPFILFFAVGVTIFSYLSNTAGAQQSIKAEQNEPMLTNVLQLRHLAFNDELTSCSVQLEGTVVWVSQARAQFILQDDSGMMALNLNLNDYPSLKPGHKVRLRASCIVGHGLAACTALVDNDGDHSFLEESGTIFLSKGRHPICVEWFNIQGQFGLDVEWMGPKMSRRPIPDDSLFRSEINSTNGTNRLAQGLDYRCYEGKWIRLPNFFSLPVKRQGVVNNFDLGVRTRANEVGLVFSGYIGVPRDGVYTFWTKSDDGSKLFIGDPAIQLDILGVTNLPPSQTVQPVLSQAMSEGNSFKWAEVEGTVTFVRELSGAWYLDLRSSTGHVQIQCEEGTTDSLKHLLGCRIRATGILQPAVSIAKQPEFSLLVPSLQQITVIEVDPEYWIDYPIVPIHLLTENNFKNSTQTMVHIIGIVSSNLADHSIMINDQTGQIGVKTTQALPPVGKEIEALGWLSHSENKWLLESAFYREVAPKTNTESASSPFLSQAAQAKQLTRAEAQRGHPIKIRGVITARIVGGFAIQDPTWSIFFKLNDTFTGRVPKVGEYWEIAGKTTNIFAPSIEANHAVYLADGILPEPSRPTRDELINGSLDTQYIEIQGIVISVKTNSLVLLTREGKIRLQLYDNDPQILNGLEGALVCIRGVNSPERNGSQQVIVASLRLFNASVNVDEPALISPFETPMKRVSDLLLFDPKAKALKRVKIAGQVIYKRHGEYFLMDGVNGLRFKTQVPIELNKGDLVEVVGFPDMNGSSPALREALAQRSGATKLPVARQLPGNTLDGQLDATLVRMQARLMDSSVDPSEQVLELQAGNRIFVARLKKEDGNLPNILPGSLLELTGVYAGQGGDWASGRDIDSFELLLDSPSAVHVLARPSWWTVRHSLEVLSGMVLVVLGAFVWIALLRQQVEERSLRLAAEIQRREQTEHQRTLEAERSRIAQDLHDDLGATLTQIRFLSAVESSDSAVPKATREQLKQVSEKSHQMMTSLDEIVWAVNPANDSVRSLAAYLRHVASEFFCGTPINCRFDVDKSLPMLPLTSEVRHNLYLAVREALNNSARHSNATELWLRIHWREKTMQIIIEDNGDGFIDQQTSVGGNGLSNMRLRMEKIGGHFEHDTHLGAGTICRMYLKFL